MHFYYLEPKTVKEAVSLIGKHDTEAKIIAGGTDLMVQMRKKTIRPKYVVDIGNIAGLDYIRYDEKKGLRIGALTPIRSLERSAVVQKRFPVLSRAASQLGSVAIRNVGTIGGNLCNASPSAETAPSLMGLSAKVRISGLGGERVIPLEDFFTGPGATVLGKGEILLEVRVPVPVPGTKGVYLNYSPRGTIDLSIVGVAVIASFEGEICQDAKVVLGAVAPTPRRARKAEAILKGKEIDEAIINQSAEVAANESCCISDVRASAEYRTQMVQVFTRRALKEIMS